jgi:hypothetical protein
MNPIEFTTLMRRWHPELLPPAWGSMSIKAGIEELCKVTGFPIPHSGDPLDKILERLWVFI